MGPHVPVRVGRETGIDAMEPRVSIKPETRFSALIFVAYNDGRNNNTDWVYPDFAYASRLKKLPWHAEPLPGIAYECGLAFRFSSGHLFWMGFYITINPETGIVRACHELIHEPIEVPKRGSYTRKKWAVSPFASEAWGKNEDERNDALARIFANAFRFWQEKDSMWSVGVRRDGRRVTFCVQPTDTKRYFKDRDKQALTSSGKRRPIIHFVNEHDREVEPGKTVKVKEHIRGLRQFYWKGYECAVTAPQFHRWTSQAFDVAPEFEEDVAEVPKDFITMDRMGAILADMEDAQQPWDTHPKAPKMNSRQVSK